MYRKFIVYKPFTKTVKISIYVFIDQSNIFIAEKKVGNGIKSQSVTADFISFTSNKKT